MTSTCTARSPSSLEPLDAFTLGEHASGVEHELALVLDNGEVEGGVLLKQQRHVGFGDSLGEVFLVRDLELVYPPFLDVRVGEYQFGPQFPQRPRDRQCRGLALVGDVGLVGDTE